MLNNTLDASYSTAQKPLLQTFIRLLETEFDTELNAASRTCIVQDTETRYSAAHVRFQITEISPVKSIKNVCLKAQISFFAEAETLANRKIKGNEARSFDNTDSAVSS